MSRLQQTDGLTEEQHGAGQARARVRRRADHPGGAGARARGRVPDGDRRGHEGDGDLRADDPRGVRRPGGVAADLRAGRRGDRARLDVGERHHQHPLHRGLHAAAARHRRAEAALPAADGDRRGPWGVLDERARAGVGRRRPSRPRPCATATTDDWSITGQKMWLTNGGSANLVAVLVQDRPRRGLGLQEHDDVPHRQDGRVRRDRPGRHDPRQDREDGLQGRRHDRAGPRRPPDHQRPDPRWRAGQGLLPDDGRRRGGPRQRRRPRLRRLDARLRARASPTPSSARRSARRSPSTRASCSASPTWRPRSRPATR